MKIILRIGLLYLIEFFQLTLESRIKSARIEKLSCHISILATDLIRYCLVSKRHFSLLNFLLAARLWKGPIDNAVVQY